MSMSIEFKLDAKQLERLAQVPDLVRHAVADRAMSAMCWEIVRKAKDIAPSSEATGTRKKWGPKYRNNPKWRVNSGRHISSKVIKTAFGVLAYVGATFPQGNKQQFNNPKEGRKEVLWNNVVSGRTYKPRTRFLQQAVDETRATQIAMFARALENGMRSQNLG